MLLKHDVRLVALGAMANEAAKVQRRGRPRGAKDKQSEMTDAQLLALGSDEIASLPKRLVNRRAALTRK